MKTTILVLAQLAFAGCLIPGHAQQLLSNGSFEDDSVPTNLLGLLAGSESFTSSSPITDWTVGGTVSIIDTGGTLTSTLGLDKAPAGNQYAVLNSLGVNVNLGVGSLGINTNAQGSLSQTLTTIVGEKYTISFDTAALGLSLGGSAGINVSVTNATGVASSTTGGSLIDLNASGFQEETVDFVATGTSSDLTFSEPADSLVDVDGVGLDDVALQDDGMAPVPEPSQYAAGAMGFLFLLVAARLIRRPRLVEGDEDLLSATV